MSWKDFLYTKGITEADLSAAQHTYWRGLWEKQYGPQIAKKLLPPVAELNVNSPVSELPLSAPPEIDLTPPAEDIQ